MIARDVAKLIDAIPLNLADDEREIVSGYSGDFLSFVMGKVPQDSVWLTVMSNVNVCAVATLADVGMVVLCEGVEPDDALLEKVKVQGVNLYSTNLDAFSAACKLQGKL